MSANAANIPDDAGMTIAGKRSKVMAGRAMAADSVRPASRAGILSGIDKAVFAQ